MDNNLEPKNDYFSKKDEKDRAIEEERRKKMIKKATGWLVILAGLGLLVIPIYSYFKKAATEQVSVPGEYFKAQSRDHIDIGATHPEYNSNPPTGGWHYAVPAQTGIYDKPFADQQLVHNLEHGHIWMAYKPNLSSDQIEKMANLAKSYGSKIIMAPREANPTPIVLVAWEHLFKMDTLDEAQARAFIDAYLGHGPELITDYGFKDFRKK